MKSKVQINRQSRQMRVRKSVRGTTERPRLHVFRSNRYFYAQIINDETHSTLVSVSEKQQAVTGTKTEKAIALGKELAVLAQKAKVTQVAFDRGYYRYHGRVKSFADAARAAGLSF